MLKIYLTGTESSGKTTLAQSLSKHYACPWVPEYARQYLQERSGKYKYEDLEMISKGQLALEQEFAQGGPAKLIIDTGQLVLYIWSMHKYGRVASQIATSLKAQQSGFHLLCSPDLAWEEDPLRESPTEREALFEKYKEALDAFELDYTIVERQGVEREENAVHEIEGYLKG